MDMKDDKACYEEWRKKAAEAFKKKHGENYEEWAMEVVKKSWMEKSAIRILIVLGGVTVFSCLPVAVGKDESLFVNIIGGISFSLLETVSLSFLWWRHASAKMLTVDDYLIQRQTRKMVMIHIGCLAVFTGIFFLLKSL